MNKLGLIISFLTLTTIVNVNGQSPVLTVKQQNNDFAIFKGGLIEGHSGIYYFIGKTAFESKCDSVQKTFEEGATIEDYYLKIRYLSFSIHHGHTGVSLGTNGNVNYKMAVLDSSRLYLPFELVIINKQLIIKKEEPKIETNDSIQIKPTDADAQQVSKKEESKAAAQEPTIIKSVVETEQPIVKEEIESSREDGYKKSIVTKKSESSTTEGFGLVFLDTHQNGTPDTIRLIIPNPKPVVPAVKMEIKEDIKFLDIVSDIPKTEERPPQITEEKTKKEQVKEVLLLKQSNNNNCTVVADENDFLKIRKIMAAVETEDEMVSSALNYFKTKCFTVTQIKNLGTLFLTDAGKYKFFDAAYLYVTDLVNFSSLQTELKDEYYINRFKAMLR